MGSERTRPGVAAIKTDGKQLLQSITTNLLELSFLSSQPFLLCQKFSLLSLGHEPSFAQPNLDTFPQSLPIFQLS